MRDKVVLITGPARGLGELTARRLGAQGAKLALVGLEGERLQALSDELGGHFWREVDVSDRDATEAAVKAAKEHYGRLDVVVANAGIACHGPLTDVDPDVFERVMRVNFFGVWHAMRASVPHLLESSGYFLAVASMAASIPLVNANAYSPSKAAVEMLVDTLRLELSHTPVKAGVAYFSFMETDMVSNNLQDEDFAFLRSKMPKMLATIYPASVAVDALVRGIERRSARIVAPAGATLVLWLRGLLAPLLPYRAKTYMRELSELARKSRRTRSED